MARHPQKINVSNSPLTALQRMWKAVREKRFTGTTIVQLILQQAVAGNMPKATAVRMVEEILKPTDENPKKLARNAVSQYIQAMQSIQGK